MNNHLQDAIEFAAIPGKRGYHKYSKSIGGRSPSLRWPHLFDLLRAKGYSAEKAARISNSRVGMRKKGRLEGLTYGKANDKKALKRELRRYEKKRKNKALTAAIEFAQVS